MINRNLLSTTVLLMLLASPLVIGFAQTTTLATVSPLTDQIAPVPTQQIGRAFEEPQIGQAESYFGAEIVGQPSTMATSSSLDSGTTITQAKPDRSDSPSETPSSMTGTWYQLDQSTFPDAPSATQKVEDAPASYGYWDYTQPQMSFRKTATDPTFYAPFLGLLAANAIDIEATRASGCGEAHDFGRRPSRLSQYGQDYAADFAIGTMAFFMHRSHFRLIPQGMLGYGIAIHIRGAVLGFQANCH